MASHTITEYRATIYGRQEKRDISRIIHLYSEGKIVGTCAFYRTRQVPVSYKQGSRFYITYHEDAYPDVIDLLRNESPVTATFSESNGLGYLATKQEKVGEDDRG